MINLATATSAELAAAGYKLTVKRSQAQNKRASKWVRPACNNAGHVPTPAAQANQNYRGTI